MKIYSPQVTGSLEVSGKITQGNNSNSSDTSVLLASTDSLISASAVNAAVVASTGSYVSTARPNAAVIASETSYNNSTNSSTKNTAVVASQNSRVTGTGEAREVFIAGTLNSLNQGSRFSAIVGGENHTLTGFYGNAIAGGGGSSMTQGVYSFIGGGLSNQIGSSTQADFSAIIAGASNVNNGDLSVIIGGQSNTIAGTFTRSVVIGGNGISAAASDTVYVPNFVATGSVTVQGDLTVTGSIIGTVVSASFATTANTASYFDLSTVNQDVVITGSVRGEVGVLSISSNTASLDLSTGNFYTLQLVEGTDTYINPSNIQPGQTINIRVNTTGSATVSFPASVLQANGNTYVPTTTTGVDVLTLISFDASSLYLSNVKNLV